MTNDWDLFHINHVHWDLNAIQETNSDLLEL